MSLSERPPSGSQPSANPARGFDALFWPAGKTSIHRNKSDNEEVQNKLEVVSGSIVIQVDVIMQMRADKIK